MKNKVWIIDSFRKQLMKRGGLATADRIVQQAFLLIKQENKNPWVIIFQAIQATRPLVHLKTIRIGKSSVSIPSPVPEKQQPTMAIRWLVQQARIRKDKRKISDKLVAELYDAAIHRKGGAVQQKIRMHQLAEKNLGQIRSNFTRATSKKNNR